MALSKEENYISQLRGDIKLLEEKWAYEYPRRAKGGVAALSGFYYQFVLFLLEAVKRWINLPSGKEDLGVFTECLSDILNLTGQNIVIISQVKRTVTSKSIKDALEELWEIYRISLKETPNLSSRLRFRILSSSVVLQ